MKIHQTSSNLPPATSEAVRVKQIRTHSHTSGDAQTLNKIQTKPCSGVDHLEGERPPRWSDRYSELPVHARFRAERRQCSIYTLVCRPPATCDTLWPKLPFGGNNCFDMSEAAGCTRGSRLCSAPVESVWFGFVTVSKRLGPRLEMFHFRLRLR